MNGETKLLIKSIIIEDAKIGVFYDKKEVKELARAVISGQRKNPDFYNQGFSITEEELEQIPF